MSMRHVVRVLLLVLTVAVPAGAVTLRDIIELTRAGLSEDVIVALLEADQTRFTLDAGQIIELRSAGVSERVIVAMLESRQKNVPAPQPVPAAQASEGHLVPAPVPVPVGYPVYLPMPVVVGPPARAVAAGQTVNAGHMTPGRFINDGFTSIAVQPTPLRSPWPQAVDPRDIWTKRPSDGGAKPPRH